MTSLTKIRTPNQKIFFRVQTRPISLSPWTTL